MTSTALPPHAAVLLAYLRERGPQQLDNTGLFECWRETDLSDCEIIAGLDYLATIGAVERSNETLRCRVKVKGTK